MHVPNISTKQHRNGHCIAFVKASNITLGIKGKSQLGSLNKEVD